MPTFANPLALWGLALASAPIIIHLLNRRRFKVVEWAAMEFLLASSRRNYRRIRLEQLILMALRMLIIAVLVLVVSRPLVRGRALAGLGERRRLVVLVFDASMSMGCRDGALNAYDRGIAFAEELMSSLREGETWALVVAAGQPKAVSEEPSFNLEAARSAVARDRIPLSDLAANIPAALERAAEILERSKTPAKEVYLVTDLQRTGWLGPDGVPTPEQVAALKRLSEKARVVIVDVGSQEPANLAITALETDDAPVVVGGQVVLRVSVANYGPTTTPDVRVHLLVDGFRQQTSAPRTIGPGETTAWEFRHVFRTPGPHTITVELPNDNLDRDNRRFLALDVRKAVRVLLVDGEPGSEPFTGETDYLREALQPGGDAGDVSSFAPQTITPEALTAAELPTYDAVVLANVERLPQLAVATFEAYVREGGALLVFPGDRIDRAFYRQAFYSGGDGLLPCWFGEASGDPVERKTAAHLADDPGEHPFLRLFREQKVIRLSSPSFYRRVRLEGLIESPEVRVACRFADGWPAIVERRVGRGRVVVFASTADDEWNDMPAWPAYLTLMQEILLQVARSSGASRNLVVGEPLVRSVPPELFGRPVRLVRPGGQRPLTLQPIPSEGRVVVTYDETDRAGLYELVFEGQGAGHDFVAVNVPPRESDVRRITGQELRKAFPGFSFDYQRGRQRRVQSVARAAGGELWRPLAYTLLVLLFLETFLAQRFSR